MDPTKDLAAYGYGSVAWKDKMDDWKQRQEKMQMMMSDGGALHPKDMDDGNGPDLPMYVTWPILVTKGLNDPRFVMISA